MIVGHLQVMLAGNILAIAKPGTHDVRREVLGQFRLAAAATVVEWPLPHGQAGAANNLLKRRPQVAVPPVVHRVRRQPAPNRRSPRHQSAEKEKNDFLAGVPAIVDTIIARKIQCRVYRRRCSLCE
jgi:hypothetical protein